MIYTLDELREKIAPIAEKYRIPAVYIFGSYARGEATEESDVDVLIDREGSDIRSLWDLGGLYNDLNEGLRKEFSVITLESLHQANVRRRTPKLIDNVMRERVPVYEKQRFAAH